VKELFLDLFKGALMGICFVVFCLILATASRSAYANTVHLHGELVLADYQFSNGVHSAPCGFFVRNISMRSHFMAKLGRDTFYVCRYPFEPVCQPFSALPPLLGSIWQSSCKFKRSALIMPNQINTELFASSEYQSKERIQTWIDAIADNKRYCFDIAVGLADSDIAYPLGNWNIPFYSIEEANQFKKAAQLKYPDSSFNFITGTLHIEKAMEDVSYVFWDKWQNKHNERISLLNNNEGSHNA